MNAEQIPARAAARPPSAVVTALLAAGVAALCLTVWVQMAVVLPRTKKAFDELGLQLPLATKELMIWSRSDVFAWCLTPPGAIGLALAGAAVIGLVRHTPRLQWVGWPLVVVLLVGLLVTNVTVGASVALSRIKMQEALSRRAGPGGG